MKNNSLKILFIRPPFTRLRGTGQAPYFPLGIGYLASVANQLPNIVAKLYYPENPPAHKTNYIVDKEGVFFARSEAQKLYWQALQDDNHPVWLEYKSVLTSFKPDIIGISALTPEVGSGLKVSKIAKAMFPEIIVVWGGIHASFEPASVLQYQEVDCIVVGEGEQTIQQLLLNIQEKKALDNIPGVITNADTIEHCTQRSLIKNLDELPYPARDSCWFPKRFSPVAMGSLMHSRGCPWRCGFCSSRRFWQERVRFRSADDVVKEIKKIQIDYGINVFTFWDDAFTIDRQLTENLCRCIIDEKLKIGWRTATRVDLLDNSLLRLMKRAGCIQLELGIETGSPRMSKIIRKDINLDKTPEIIDQVNHHGMACGVFFMAGFPDETREDLTETLNFMKSIKPAEIVLNIFDPMPGSEQFDRAIELGLLPQIPDYEKFPLWPEAHYVQNIEPEEFNVLIENISRYVFEYNSSRAALFRRAKPEIIQLLKSDPGMLFSKSMNFLRNRIKFGSH